MECIKNNLSRRPWMQHYTQHEWKLGRMIHFFAITGETYFFRLTASFMVNNMFTVALFLLPQSKRRSLLMRREAFFPQDDITLVAPALCMLSVCMFRECGNICPKQILTVNQLMVSLCFPLSVRQFARHHGMSVCWRGCHRNGQGIPWHILPDPTGQLPHNRVHYGGLKWRHRIISASLTGSFSLLWPLLGFFSLFTSTLAHGAKCFLSLWVERKMCFGK